MNSGVFKVIILGILLVVLAFVVGSQAAASSQSALAILAGLGGVFLLIVMGRRAWWLIYILPPLLGLAWRGPLSLFACAHVVASAVLVYWVIMWGMGYVRVTWHRALWLDVLVFSFFGYLAVSYYLHPATINALVDETDVGTDVAIGGRIYLTSIPAFFSYIAVSLIPCTLKELHRALRLAFWATFAGTLVSVVIGLAGFGGGMEEAMVNSRFGMFSSLGKHIINALICCWPLTSILFSPWRLLLMLVAVVCVMLSGFRSMLLYSLASIAFMSVVWRQLLCVVLLSFAGLGAVYLASSEGLLVKLPMGIQRTLHVLPGVKILPHIAADAKHSADWRFEMWKWAMDPRAGYIHDYTWGDGFGSSLQGMRRDMTLIARGRMAQGSNEFFAERGVWHNGLITTIQCVGYVGLAILLLTFVVAIAMYGRLCMAVRGTPVGVYIMFFGITLLYNFMGYLIAGGPGVLPGAVILFAFLKAATGLVKKEGMLPPLFRLHNYIPLAIREHEEAVAKGSVPALPAGM